MPDGLPVRTAIGFVIVGALAYVLLSDTGNTFVGFLVAIAVLLGAIAAVILVVAAVSSAFSVLRERFG